MLSHDSETPGTKVKIGIQEAASVEMRIWEFPNRINDGTELIGISVREWPLVHLFRGLNDLL